MTRRVAVGLAVAALLVAACAEALPVGPVEVVGEASDDQFLFVVRSDADRYGAGQPITVAAEVLYQGPKASETIYHGESPVGWQIVQLDGPAAMQGGMGEPCLQTELRNGAVARYRFEKAGVIDEVGPFDRGWFERRDVLTLPAGRWRFIGSLLIAVDDCGGPRHDLQATVDVMVVP